MKSSAGAAPYAPLISSGHLILNATVTVASMFGLIVRVCEKVKISPVGFMKLFTRAKVSRDYILRGNAKNRFARKRYSLDFFLQNRIIKQWTQPLSESFHRKMLFSVDGAEKIIKVHLT